MKFTFQTKLTSPLKVLVLILFVNSCIPLYNPTTNNNETNDSNGGTNVASIYNPYITTLHPNYQIYNKDSNTTIIVARIYKSEILFNNANSEKKQKGKVQFKLNLYKIENDARILADTLSFLYDVELKSYENVFFAYLPLKREANAKYSLHVIYTDLLKRKFAISYLDINEVTKNTEQNYLTLPYGNSYPSFKLNFNSDEFFKIEEHILQDSVLYVEKYGFKYPLPRPPASITEAESTTPIPDTVITIKKTPNLTFMQKEIGMYRYTKDLESNNGLTLFTFANKDYPRMKSSEQMILPLQYLVSTKEFEKLINVNNKKLALDKFWLSLCNGDEEKARQLLKIFYTRVMFANNYFLSYTEGWQTDRGMIYILYGPPKVIQKNYKKEKWIYGASKNSQALAFTFYKKDHPFSSNHFELLRSNIYSASWRKAVTTWRSGAAYSGT